MTTRRSTAGCLAAALLAAGCGGSSGAKTPGGTPGGGTGGTAGIALPREISALPTRTATGSASASRLALAAQPLDASTDYGAARTVKSVDEPALSQFDILNTIFNALGQTHYADAENVGSGPYGAMVSWVEDHGDSQQKQVNPWVVDSSLTTEGGKPVNVVRIWMKQQMGDGLLHLIKVGLRIYEAPTQRADGSYADYGVWTLDAKFDDTGTRYFAASAARDATGGSVVMLHEVEATGKETRGVLHKSDAAGYGQVVYPDYSSCNSPDCTPTPVAVAYVYDADHVALKQGATVVFKDRTNVVDLVNRYGLYDAASGADVARTHAFGFPVQFTDASGNPQYGYYGAWQGRHQLWANGAAVPAGTVVTRQDRASGQPVQQFTVSPVFTGTLVKRTLVAADVQDVKDLVVETWVNLSQNLRFDGTQWQSCVNPDYSVQPPACGAGSGPFTDFQSLVVSPGDTRRMVNVSYFDQAAMQPRNLVYDPAGPSGAGFYYATGGMGAPAVSTGVAFTPTAGAQLWVNVSGSIYISFDGTSWVQKTLVSFDPSTYTPTFAPAATGDHPYVLELGREYYINNPGANYVVKRTAAATYDVRIELQSVANPVNAATFVPAGTTFQQQMGGTSGSTFQFVTDAASPSFMKLVYLTVGQADATAGAKAGDVVKTGQWGLAALQGGQPTGVQYNWEYPNPNDGGNGPQGQQFLLAAGGAYQLLDDPLRFTGVALANHAGVTKTYALQFDGSWVNGLPDVYQDLRKDGFLLTPELAGKVVVIPDGTQVTDAADATRKYVFKPLQVREYLAVISDPGNLDLSAALGLDLSAVPGFVDAGLGALPDVAVKYSEGAKVQ
ncbi:hypothetical protein [Anaeromyxobacter paludicola]|uniref:Lipoprotein n=1 Tax=Anaeromyxobacter paludicola TaxID=2918171 RepID=A0ABN6NDR8_9BACT|nr:hypothetical protein [Anaeromyxobacter paludicola]BDG10185.1 hypothetical protein AMPC_32980 [Anaeromyxobacter paludicola]